MPDLDGHLVEAQGQLANHRGAGYGVRLQVEPTTKLPDHDPSSPNTTKFFSAIQKRRQRRIVTGAPIRVQIEAVIYVAVCLFAACGFGYALWAKRAEDATTKLPTWRQVASIIAFLAVAMQLGVFSAFWIWPEIGRDHVMFAEWARWVLPPFLRNPVHALFFHGAQCISARTRVAACRIPWCSPQRVRGNTRWAARNPCSDD